MEAFEGFSCLEDLHTELLRACEVNVSDRADWPDLWASVLELTEAHPSGDAGGGFDGSSLFVETIHPGRAELIHYLQFDTEDDEHRAAKEIRNTIIRLTAHAARGATAP
jgi:hypothetical protein